MTAKPTLLSHLQAPLHHSWVFQRTAQLDKCSRQQFGIPTEVKSTITVEVFKPGHGVPTLGLIES